MPFSAEVLSVRFARVIFLSTVVGPPLAYTPAQRRKRLGIALQAIHSSGIAFSRFVETHMVPWYPRQCAGPPHKVTAHR